MFIARHGQALMFCVDRSTSKAPPHARGQQNNRQETTLQTISHASEALMFRSEALRTRYINAQRRTWPEPPQTSASRLALLNASLKASSSPQEKPHASPVDRRVSLMDSLIAQIEMALLTNGMSLARNQPRSESIQENLNRPGRNNIQTCLDGSGLTGAGTCISHPGAAIAERMEIHVPAQGKAAERS